MINILPNNQCKMINIVWIERGIILTIIYYIIKKFDDIRNKTVIIDNQRYIDFLKILFPTINFSKFKKHKSRNFYFNIRNIIKKQDIVIDYLDNYDNTIRTNKISLIPWFDMNDILIIYEYDKNNIMNCNKIKKYIKEFSYCKRGNYNNQIWDSYVENYIFKKIGLFYKDIDINLFINYFNNFVKSNYTNMVIEKPKIYYVEKPTIQSNNPYNSSNNPYNSSNNPNNPSNNPNNSSNNPNNPSLLYCEYDTELFNKISNIYLSIKMSKYDNIIDSKIKALEHMISFLNNINIIYKDENQKLLNDLDFQLKIFNNIKEGINNRHELNNLLRKLSYKNNS